MIYVFIIKLRRPQHTCGGGCGLVYVLRHVVTNEGLILHLRLSYLDVVRWHINDADDGCYC